MNDATPAWERPSFGPHVRWRALFAAAVTLAGGIALGHVLTRPRGAAVVPVIAPVKVVLPAQAAPVVNVQVPAPAPPPPPVEPSVAEPVAPHAQAPTIRAACVIATDDQTSLPASCAWDDGFPAISADGRTIVTKVIPYDGGRGNPGLSVDFVDVKTSRVLESAVVLAPDEYEIGATEPATLVAKMTKRAAVIQRRLDAGRYRTLASIGNSDDSSSSEDPAPARPTTTYAEIAGTAVRVVDPPSATVLWEGDVHVAGSPTRDPDQECSGWNLHSTFVWWDAPTRTVLARQTYFTGGCMCPDLDYDLVRRAP